MIRHHVAQDLLSADATSIYPVMGVVAIPHTVPHPGYVVIQTTAQVGYGTASNHPLSFYATPLLTFALIAVSIVAVLALVKGRWHARHLHDAPIAS